MDAFGAMECDEGFRGPVRTNQRRERAEGLSVSVHVGLSVGSHRPLSACACTVRWGLQVDRETRVVWVGGARQRRRTSLTSQPGHLADSATPGLDLTRPRPVCPGCHDERQTKLKHTRIARPGHGGHRQRRELTTGPEPARGIGDHVSGRMRSVRAWNERDEKGCPRGSDTSWP